MKLLVTPSMADLLRDHRREVTSKMRDAFLNFAMENRGALTSARYALVVSEQIYDLATTYLDGETAEEQVMTVTRRLAEQGLATTTIRNMLTILNNYLGELPGRDTAIESMMVKFQLLLLENLATAREEVLRNTQEASQAALQNALHNQLQQQRNLRQDQESRTQKLQQILQLNAELAQVTQESELLNLAVSGICRNLDLTDVTIYEWLKPSHRWFMRTTTGPLKANQPIPNDILEGLSQAIAGHTELHQHPPLADGRESERIISLLQTGSEVLGAMVANFQNKDASMPIFVKAFALNLAALWGNLLLLLETRQRTQELEILNGRYFDTIWRNEDIALQANYAPEAGLTILRSTPQPQIESDPEEQVSLLVGGTTIGQISLDEGAVISAEDSEFMQALAREMSNALNNAHLLQTTRNYSHQLRTAVEVSRAVSAFLDRGVLIQEAVELIQRHFNFYYVALYLKGSNLYATLQAAVGPAGEFSAGQQTLWADHNSIVDTAIHSQRPYLERDVRQSTRYEPDPQLPDTRSILVAPLRARGTTIGAIDIHSTQVAAFGETEVTVLQLLADQIAVALENANLFDETQTSYIRTNYLYQAGRHIIEAVAESEVYQAIVEFSANTGLVDVAFLLINDPDSAEHIVVGQSWSRFNLITESSPTHILRTAFPFTGDDSPNRLFVSKDIQTEGTFPPALLQFLTSYGIQAIAFIPIRFERIWLATLALCRLEARPLTDHELQPFLTLSGQAAVALSNQRLLRETRALYQVSQVLDQAVTAEDAILATVEAITRYTGLSQTRAVMYDQRNGYGTVIVESTPSGRAAAFQFPIQGDPLYQQLLQEKRPILADLAKAIDPTSQAYLHYFGLQGSCFLPILSQQKVAGFLALDYQKQGQSLQEPDIIFAQNATDQLATFLENIALFDEALLRAQEMIKLNQIGSLIASTLKLDDLAAIIYEQVGLLLDKTCFLMALYDADNFTYTPLLSMVESRPEPLLSREIEPNSALHHFLQQGELVQGRPAVQLAQQFVNGQAHKIQSALWSPLQREGSPVGFITLQSYRLNAYSESDIQLFRSIATQISLAVTNALLLRETQDNVAELRLLFSITQAAAGSIDANARINNMANALHQGLRKADVAILAPAAENHYRVIAAAGQKQELVPAGGLVAEAMNIGQPLLVNDLRQLPEYQPFSPQAYAQLVIPLSLGQRHIGVINVTAGQPNAFNQRDLRLLETLSINLATTIESARLFEEIQLANERLLEIDRVKTNFLASMSHELRTPLNSIIGFSRVILRGIDGPITPQQEEDLTSIYNSGQHLLQLINEILDLAKIEAGKMTLAFEPTNPREIAQNALSNIRGLLKDKPIELISNLAPDLPMIEVDPIRLRQIIINLLSNAIKFTLEGQVTLAIYPEADGKHISISVADTGVGIAQKDFDKLFEAFEQAEDKPKWVAEGTGLGLTITRSLVEMHHGQIWLESELGRGTTFYIRLPIHQEAPNN